MPSNHRSADHEWRRTLKEQPMCQHHRSTREAHRKWASEQKRAELRKKVLKARKRNRGTDGLEFINGFLMMALVLILTSGAVYAAATAIGAQP